MEQSKITEYFRARRGGPRGISKTAEPSISSKNGTKVVTKTQPATPQQQTQPKIKQLPSSPEPRTYPKPLPSSPEPRTYPKPLPSSPEPRTYLNDSPIRAKPPEVGSWAPKRLSRGQRLVQLSRQKELAKTPLKRPSTSDTTTDSDSVGKRRRLTARRKLLPFYESSDNADREASTSSKQEETIEKTLEPKIHEFKFIEFASPKKKEIEKARPLPSLGDTGEPDLDQLPLPAAYSLLKEKFHCADTVVSMLQNRNEMCTFSKLKRGVEKMMRRHFEELDLGKIKTVYPDAYTFTQETNIPGEYSAGRYYHLVITLNSADPHLSAVSLVKRRQIFRNRLLAIVKKHHRDFLSRLDPPLEIPDHKVLRWHAGFSTDSVPAIEAALLPAPPFVARHVSAKDVLSFGTCPEKIPTKSDPGTVDLALKGVSTELLEKIRAKEASRALKNITRNSDQEKELQILSTLPDIVRIIRGFFVAERQAAILWEKVREKVAESYSSLPPDRVDEHLVYLVEISEGRISTVTLKNQKYIKIRKDIDLKAFFKILKDKQDVLKC